MEREGEGYWKRGRRKLEKREKETGRREKDTGKEA